MTRKKILQITSYPPPRAGWGVRVEFLKKRLESQGHHCVVLNLGRNRTVPSPDYETVMNGFDYLRKVWRFSHAGYLVHVHVNGDSPKGFVLTLVAELLSLAFGRRCILTFHAGVDQIYFPRHKCLLLSPMFWLMFAIPHRIICNSTAVKMKIAEYGVRESKVVSIPAFTRQYLEFARVNLHPAIEHFYRRYARVIFTYVRIRPGFYLDTLVEGFALVARGDPDVGLALCGVAGDIDPELWRSLQQRIERFGLTDRVRIIEDLGHDEFRVALTRSVLYLRTPTTDGVASSVLEALALGVPVVAAENWTRPPGVVTYRPSDATDLARAVEQVLLHRDAAVASIPKFEVPDTLEDEIGLLTA